MFQNLIFLAVLKLASAISAHNLQKRHNFHNKAAVAAAMQTEKSKPERLFCFVLGRLWICCTPSVPSLFHISLSTYIYAGRPSCLCSSTLPFLTPPIPPISQMDYLNNSLFTPAEYKSRAKMLTGVGTAPSKVSPGMAVGHNIYPRHPEPAALIPTRGLSQQWCHGSSEGREAFCLSPSGIGLAGHSPAILLNTFSARQYDPASHCQQLLGM